MKISESSDREIIINRHPRVNTVSSLPHACTPMFQLSISKGVVFILSCHLSLTATNSKAPHLIVSLSSSCGLFNLSLCFSVTYSGYEHCTTSPSLPVTTGSEVHLLFSSLPTLLIPITTTGIWTSGEELVWSCPKLVSSRSWRLCVLQDFV